LASSIQIEPIQPQQELAAIGTSTPAAQQKVADASSAPAIAAQTAVMTATETASTSRPDASPDGIKQVQIALKAAGYDPGPADGRMGARTKTAIRDFQVANGLQADGKVGPKTWAKLQAVASNTTTTTSTQQ
jgi:peptidoglycan hydrolase-like protein with peptidoglycan-binding domain